MCQRDRVLSILFKRSYNNYRLILELNNGCNVFQQQGIVCRYMFGKIWAAKKVIMIQSSNMPIHLTGTPSAVYISIQSSVRFLSPP